MASVKSVWSRTKRRAQRVAGNEPMALSIRPTHLLVGGGIGLVAAYIFYDMGRASGYRDGSTELALLPTGRENDPSMFVSQERRWVDLAEERERAQRSAEVLEESLQAYARSGR